MTTALPDDQRERLTRLCGMFGSDYEGERANAARMADELLRRHGVTWADVLAPPALPPPERPQRGWREPRGAREAAVTCLLFPEALTFWEREFCQSLATQVYEAREKQYNILKQILDKCRAYAQAGAPA